MSDLELQKKGSNLHQKSSKKNREFQNTLSAVVFNIAMSSSHFDFCSSSSFRSSSLSLTARTSSSMYVLCLCTIFSSSLLSISMSLIWDFKLGSKHQPKKLCSLDYLLLYKRVLIFLEIELLLVLNFQLSKLIVPNCQTLFV